VRELSDRRRNLETLVQNGLLALKTDVFRPFDETAKVSLRLDMLANTKVLGSSLEKRVLFGLGRLATEGSSGRLLGGFGGGFGLVIETKSALIMKRTMRLGALTLCKQVAQPSMCLLHRTKAQHTIKRTVTFLLVG